MSRWYVRNFARTVSGWGPLEGSYCGFQSALSQHRYLAENNSLLNVWTRSLGSAENDPGRHLIAYNSSSHSQVYGMAQKGVHTEQK